ncbi:MAG: peptidylprolyl isomerase [Pseudohongiellaceae bacterium]
MKQTRIHVLRLIVTLSLCWTMHAAADLNSAMAAMESRDNPLLLVSTSQGAVYIELYPGEAPRNATFFSELAQGESVLADPRTGASLPPSPYFDGLAFYRSIPGLLVQAGIPWQQVTGLPVNEPPEEINAAGLGLNRIPLFNPDGSLNERMNVSGRRDFENRVLIPLYRSLGVESEQELVDRQDELRRALDDLTLQQAYENNGINFSDGPVTRPFSRGSVGLVRSLPGSNGPEFFIMTADADWLTGRYTVVGRVVEGMEVVERIDRQTASTRTGSPNRAEIQTMRQVNQRVD